MNLNDRVHRLETAHRTGTCSACGGKGILVVSYHTDGEPTPVASGCSACGALTHVIVDFRDEHLPGRPAVALESDLTGAEMAALYA